MFNPQFLASQGMQNLLQLMHDELAADLEAEDGASKAALLREPLGQVGREDLRQVGVQLLQRHAHLHPTHKEN